MIACVLLNISKNNSGLKGLIKVGMARVHWSEFELLQYVYS